MVAGRLLGWVGMLVLVAGASPSMPSRSAAEEPPSSRFFFSGDGQLQLSHAHWSKTLDVRYRRADGSYDADALAALRRFFRSRRDDVEGGISLRLVELLDFVGDRHPNRAMVLYSAFRSPEFNQQLPGTARASLHTQGLAADIGIEGVDLRRLWRELRQLRTGGVGFYPEGYLHLDAGEPRFWEASTSRVGENLSDGNARVFARTDYDRYAIMDDAVITLHSVTVFPLRLALDARLVDLEGHAVDVRLAAAGAFVVEENCVRFDDPLIEPRLTVVRGPSPQTVPQRRRGRLHLRPCAPRLERTPAEIVSNQLEWTQ